MAFLIAAGTALVILCGLLSNIRLHYGVTVERRHADLYVQARAFFGLARFKLRGRVTFFPLELFTPGGKAKLLRKKRPEKGKEKGSNPLSRELFLHRELWLRADKLRVRGAVGSESDACAAIVGAGAVSIALDCLFRILLSPQSMQVRVLPVCGARCFCLNLEGIVTLRVWQIIGVAIRHQIRGTRGKKLWRIPLKTS